mmetsp:Transcript_30156/g.48646  ORF Transcript_30156/g.48646 Transcript_30156/m.48646 type:complete len:170 (+) Transcript_30156:23-532(+)
MNSKETEWARAAHHNQCGFEIQSFSKNFESQGIEIWANRLLTHDPALTEPADSVGDTLSFFVSFCQTQACHVLSSSNRGVESLTLICVGMYPPYMTGDGAGTTSSLDSVFNCFSLLGFHVEPTGTPKRIHSSVESALAPHRFSLLIFIMDPRVTVCAGARYDPDCSFRV